MKHVWRHPAFSRNKSNKPNNAWLPFVCDSHLEWLMDAIDRLQRGEVLDAEDTEHYNIIKEQAERFMVQAEAEGWPEDDRRLRMAW